MALCEEQSVPCLPIFPSQGKLVPVLYLLEQWGSLPGERPGEPSAVLRQSRSVTVRPLGKSGVRPRYWSLVHDASQWVRGQFGDSP